MKQIFPLQLFFLLCPLLVFGQLVDNDSKEQPSDFVAPGLQREGSAHYSSIDQSRNDSIMSNDAKSILTLGLTFGLNYADFALKKSKSIKEQGFEDVYAEGDAGFHLGVVFNVKVNDNWHFRYAPTLSLADRYVFFRPSSNQGENELIEHFELTQGELPLHLVYHFGTSPNNKLYVLAGVKYIRQINHVGGWRLSQKQNDFQVELGVGSWLVKGSIIEICAEIKASVGLRNIKDHGWDDREPYNTLYNSIDRMHSKVIYLSFLIYLP